ncbi:PKD domain-containing protein [Cellulomonas endophytica]|uniref:PKD domain-containing protein n=1 Tax=Cellulomonas endophytica TaxID=2494735 RepID=UPI001012478F|nr:PKD domain-containing protein [Cellulomonas endophytica]
MLRRRLSTALTVLLLAGLAAVPHALPGAVPGAVSGAVPGAVPAVGEEAPAAAAAGEVHLVAAGDWGAGASTRAVLGRVAALAPDAALALGDLSYGVTGQEQAWCDLVVSLVGPGFPFQLVSGNHESNGQNGNINDFSACLPNQLPGLVGTYGRQWYVDVPAADPLVRVVMISPSLPFPQGVDDYRAGSPRYQWTAAAVDGARAAGVPWVVVGMHEPCVSLGQYGCGNRGDLMRMLLEKRVDLVLSGHEHLYQRTGQIALSAGCPSLVVNGYDPDCVVDRDGELVRGAGTVLATVGTGGVAMRPVNAADAEAGYFVAANGDVDPTWGVLDLRLTPDALTARFERAAGGTFADAFTVRAGDVPANTPPTAALSASCTGLTCTVDGRASTDPDGTVAAHRWTFGDGGSADGPTATHTWTAGGTSTVTLTVTDDRGATASTTRTVTLEAPAGTPFAADAFGRTVSGGWGTADAGGAWRTTAGTAPSVGGGQGVLPLVAGRTLTATLPGVSAPSTDLVHSVVADKPSTGGGLYLTSAARRVEGVGEYAAKVRLRPQGVVSVGLARTLGTTETALGTAVVVPGLAWAPGEPLLVRVQASGTGPTTLRARVWRVGSPEPATWQVQATDGTASLQAAGGVGVAAYLSSSATNGPVTVRVDDLVGRAP